MTRVTALVPVLVISAYMTIGGAVRFDAGVMRVVSPALLLIIGPAVYAAIRRRRSTAPDKAFVAYIALAAVGFSVWPAGMRMVMAGFAAALLYFFLFLAATVPPLLGREPFTAQFARRVAPRAVWETEIFKRICLNLNSVWAVIFAACIVSALLPALSVTGEGFGTKMLWEVIAPMALILGAGLPVSKYYPDYYMRKTVLRPEGDHVPRSGPNPVKPAPRPGVSEENMDDKRKVVAINGSPQEGVSNISQMIAMLAKTFAEEGFETEEVFLNRQRIEYCTGCAVCLEKGSCWIKDDHKKVMKKVLDADVVILGSPVYFYHVTGQMKTFLDRSLAFGHKPLRTWKPGLAVSVAAVFGEVTTAEYLGRLLPVYGAFEVGRLTALATGPGEFMGKELVEARAADLARDVVRAVREGRRYPATEHDLYYWSLIGGMIKENRDFMKADDEYWREQGLYEGFEAYVGQERSPSVASPETRKAWLKGLMKRQSAKAKPARDHAADAGPRRAGTARELLEMMPKALSPDASEGLDVTYQFEVTGSEDFTAHITIADRNATFHEGPAEKPDVIVKTPADVWLAIARGEQDGAQAFMSGKYTVEGDLNLLMKLGSLFPR